MSTTPPRSPDIKLGIVIPTLNEIDTLTDTVERLRLALSAAHRDPADTPIVVGPPALPVWLARWSRLLPPYDYDRVFCDSEVRPVIMTISVALISRAFAGNLALHGLDRSVFAGRVSLAVAVIVVEADEFS